VHIGYFILIEINFIDTKRPQFVNSIIKNQKLIAFFFFIY
jgi:hypothetical protein